MEVFGRVERNGLEVAKRKKQTNKQKKTVVARNMERKHHLNRITKEVLLSGVGRISLE